MTNGIKERLLLLRTGLNPATARNLGLLLFAWPLVVLSMILQGSRLPNFDYWYILLSIFDPQGRFLPLGLLQRANEHLIVIPKAIFAANVYVSHGSNLSLGFLTWLMYLVQSVVCIAALPRVIRDRPTVRLVFTGIVLFLLFNPTIFGNYAAAMRGVMWAAANMFAVLSIYALTRDRLATAISLGVASSFSLGSGLGVWAALPVVVWWLRRGVRRFGLLLLVGALVLGVFTFNLHTPNLPPLLGLGLLKWMVMSLAILAGNLTDHHARMVLGGSLGLVVGAFAVRKLLARRSIALDRDVAFWIGLLAYALAVAVLIAYGRRAWSIETASDDRYGSIPILFWLSLAVLLFSAQNYRRLKGWAILMFVIAVVSLQKGIDDIEYNYRFFRRQNLSAVALALGYPPEDSYLLPNFEGEPQQRLIRTLRAIDHYPFSDPAAYSCGLLGKELGPDEILTAPGTVQGLQEMAAARGGKPVQLSGWVFSGKPVRCILFANASRQIVGMAVSGFPRPDIQGTRHLPTAAVGWVGFAAATEAPESLETIAVIDEGRQRYHRLPRAH